MSIAIATNQIQNLQQIETVVTGPDGANRLYVVSGRLPLPFTLYGQSNGMESSNETYTTLIGPVFTRRQFVSAISSTAVSATAFWFQGTAPYSAGWTVTDDSADWDDQSGQVKLVVGVSIHVTGVNNNVTLGGVAFQVTILAEM